MGTAWKELEERISAEVTLWRRAGLEKFEGSEPSGCSFWQLAAAGRSFYTVPENHFNCAGAHTHNSAASGEIGERTLGEGK